MNEKEGYLEKEGGTVKTWKIRWFCLFQSTLSYYKTRKDTKPLGSIDLTDCQVFIVDDFYRKRKLEFLFQLKLPKRTFNIIAPDYDTRQSWVDAILARLPNQKEIFKANFNPNSSPAEIFSDESEAEGDQIAFLPPLNSHIDTKISSLTILVEQSTVKCKETVEELKQASPTNLVDATRKVTLNVNPVFSSVYQLIAASSDQDVKSEFLGNIASLEQLLTDLISSAKDFAIQARFGKPEVAEDAKNHLHETANEFSAILDKLRPSNQDSHTKSKSRKADFRSSVLLARSTLDSTISDLAELSDTRTSFPDKDHKASQFYDAFNEIYDAINADD